MVGASRGLEETSAPSRMTMPPFSPMTVMPGRPGNMSMRVHTWRPDAGAKVTPRASIWSSSSSMPGGKFLSSSRRVPSMSTAARRRSAPA